MPATVGREDGPDPYTELNAEQRVQIPRLASLARDERTHRSIAGSSSPRMIAVDGEFVL